MDQGGEESSGAAPKAGWPAVARFFRSMTGMLPPGEKPPPTPEYLEEGWYNILVPVSSGGMLYGIATQLFEEQQRPAATSVHHHIQRFFRVTDLAMRCGIPATALALVFVGTEAVSAVHRGKENLLVDCLYGSAMVAAIHAAHRVANTRTWPPSMLGGGTVLIMGVCAIHGMAQHAQALQKEERAAAAAAEEEQRQRAELAARRGDAASRVLADLEAARQATSSQHVQQQPEGGGGFQSQLMQQEQAHQPQQVPAAQQDESLESLERRDEGHTGDSRAGQGTVIAGTQPWWHLGRSSR